MPAPVGRSLALIPAAVITALVVNDTFSVGQELMLDAHARAAGVGVAVGPAWRRVPLVAVIVAGAAVTAIVRATG